MFEQAAEAQNFEHLQKNKIAFQPRRRAYDFFYSFLFFLGVRLLKMFAKYTCECIMNLNSKILSFL